MRVSVALAAACYLALVEAAPAPGPAPQLPLEPHVALSDPNKQLPDHGLLDTRIRRLSVGQPYTILKKHGKQALGALGATRGPSMGDPAAVRAHPGDLLGLEAPVTERVGERIIRVPIRRTATGCRYYQRTDVRGQCRNKW
ncbi:Protein ENL [Frankliniella fusca]|uniref:Protein ENL n=1 Tax=Frankliniella fusca TaxID=407009 RepID=A0AAE1HM20_9NEOP|nr:Protein ENL [Frankliniella fusca]